MPGGQGPPPGDVELPDQSDVSIIRLNLSEVYYLEASTATPVQRYDSSLGSWGLTWGMVTGNRRPHDVPRVVTSVQSPTIVLEVTDILYFTKIVHVFCTFLKIALSTFSVLKLTL